jgi:SpoVK/Ycf46/Vps4 family AAA+-type ATPase
VKRHKPSVIYIPNVDAWWESMSVPAITTFTTMLRSIPPTDPVLVLATAEKEPSDLDQAMLKDLFGFSKKNRVLIGRPNRVSPSDALSLLATRV